MEQRGFLVRDLKSNDEKKLEKVGGKSAFVSAFKNASNIQQLKAVMRDAFKTLGLFGEDD